LPPVRGKPKLMTGPMTGVFGADDVVASGAMIRKLRFQMIADKWTGHAVPRPALAIHPLPGSQVFCSGTGSCVLNLAHSHSLRQLGSPPSCPLGPPLSTSTAIPRAPSPRSGPSAKSRRPAGRTASRASRIPARNPVPINTTILASKLAVWCDPAGRSERQFQAELDLPRRIGLSGNRIEVDHVHRHRGHSERRCVGQVEQLRTELQSRCLGHLELLERRRLPIPDSVATDIRQSPAHPADRVRPGCENALVSK